MKRIVWCFTACLLCGCKSTKTISDVQLRHDLRSDVSYLNGSVKISTQNHAYFANEVQNVVIEEDIIVTEYDKESGKPTKETKTKRTITQDTDKVSAKEENQSVTECNQLSAEHFLDTTKMMDAEVEEESVGGQESFGKWLGIGIGLAVVIFVVSLLKKLRVI